MRAFGGARDEPPGARDDVAISEGFMPGAHQDVDRLSAWQGARVEEANSSNEVLEKWLVTVEDNV
jgi:hypothetical protein